MKRLIYNKARFRLGIWSEEKCLSWQLPFRMLMLMLKDTSSCEKIRWWWRGSSTHPSGILFSSFLFGASLLFVLLFFIVVLSSSCVLSFVFLFVKFVLSLFHQSAQVKKTSGGVSDHRFIQKLAKTKT